MWTNAWLKNSAIMMTMMSASPLAPMFEGEVSTEELDYSGYFDEDNGPSYSTWHTLIIRALATIICISGLVGNAKVIWLLSFCIKRNPFTTYILNLAVADFGTLLDIFVLLIFSDIDPFYQLTSFVHLLMTSLFFFTYGVSLYLLTAISIERCLSVLFPIWYRCLRPGYSSAVVSFLLWILSGLLSGMLFLFPWTTAISIISIVNFLVFAPFMVGSTLTLFIKICCNSQRRQPARVYTAVLITLFFFIICAIPLSISYFFYYNSSHDFDLAMLVCLLLATSNSSINPLIYYLVGRNRNHRSRESFKVVLQRVFKEEADSRTI